jgi:hypothetical protein
MSRTGLEVADIFRHFGQAFRDQHGASLSRARRRAMAAIENCRTAALGGHVERCGDCGHQRVAYNSCRNRNCPKCQGLARAQWLEDRQAELLDAPYFHVVFTVPDEIAIIAFQNQVVVYDILFRAVSETLTRIAADPKHLGAEIGFLAVLHTWGQNLSLHPHVHCVVPGGGLSPDGTKWVGCKPGFFLPVRVLSRVFRGKFIGLLRKAFHTGKLRGPADGAALEALFDSAVATDWVVYAKPPFGGPEQVLKYLARYTHRIAISNRRIVAMDEKTVTFEYKDYARGNQRRTMTLPGTEFLRRFLMHAVPRGFMRIRHFGLLANRSKADNLERCRRLLGVAGPSEAESANPTGEALEPHHHCPACGRGRMVPGNLLEPRHDQLPDLFNDTS